MDKVVIFGVGDMAELAYFHFKHDTDYDIVAFTIDEEYIVNEKFCDLPVVAFEKINSIFSPEKYKLFVAIGYSQMNKIREKKYYESKKKGYNFVSYISSKARISGALNIGENCFLDDYCVIQPFVLVGDNVVINSGSIVGHHTQIEEHCWLGAHSVMGGRVTLGKNSFLGLNVTICDHVKIAPYTLLGAGVFISKDTVENGIYMIKSSKLMTRRSNEMII